MSNSPITSVHHVIPKYLGSESFLIPLDIPCDGWLGANGVDGRAMLGLWVETLLAQKLDELEVNVVGPESSSGIMSVDDGRDRRSTS